MDSNETIRPLTEVPVEQTSETLVSSSATAEENNATYVPKQTKEEVIERLKEINEAACNADKQELDLLKQHFYKLHTAEQAAAPVRHLLMAEVLLRHLFPNRTMLKAVSKIS